MPNWSRRTGGSLRLEEQQHLDGASNSVVTSVTVGSVPVQVAVNPTTNMIYVTNRGDFTVSVIDGATNSVSATIPVGGDPQGVTVDAMTNTVYVANEGSDSVSVINGATNTVMSTIAVGRFPWGVGVDPTRNKIYVANSTGNTAGTVSEINGSTNAVIATIGVGAGPQSVAVDQSTASHGERTTQRPGSRRHCDPRRDTQLRSLGRRATRSSECGLKLLPSGGVPSPTHASAAF